MTGMRITRRKFIGLSAKGMGGMVVGGVLLNKLGFAQSAKSSKVIVAHHPKATDGVKEINWVYVKAMMNESLLRLTGQPTVADAWGSLMTGWKPEHLIAIKVNAIPDGRLIPTHPTLVDIISEGLIQMGVPPNNIIIYDRESFHLESVGFQTNTGDQGLRCFGTTESGWGYDAGEPFEIFGKPYLLSSILTRSDHLINVPVLKVHLDRYGVTLSLKNHFGTVNNPSNLHVSFSTACAELNSQDHIKDKTRLVVIDALFGCWGSAPMQWLPDFAPNSLIVSQDPVAADAVGVKILNEERARRNQPPRQVPFLTQAAKANLGVADLESIDLIDLNLEGMDIGMTPQNLILSQWGRVRAVEY